MTHNIEHQISAVYEQAEENPDDPAWAYVVTNVGYEEIEGMLLRENTQDVDEAVTAVWGFFRRKFRREYPN
jgi:hypothetical protein